MTRTGVRGTLGAMTAPAEPLRRVVVYLADDLADDLAGAAAAEGLTVSTYLRRHLVTEWRPEHQAAA